MLITDDPRFKVFFFPNILTLPAHCNRPFLGRLVAISRVRTPR